MVISLLFLYFLGSSRIESLHKLFHKEEVAHSSLDESDPCHITLYHQQRDGGCDHTSHFVKEDKCSLCDIQFNSNPIEEVSYIVLPITFSIVSEPSSLTIFIEEVKYKFTGRGPPIS